MTDTADTARPESELSLADLQQRFVKLIAQLIYWAYSQPGYALTFGEAFRTPEQAILDAQKGTGIKKSLHTIKLAIDFNLFIDGVYRRDTPAYQKMGEYWESLDPLARWGGRFNDGNHFSITFGGFK